MRSALLVLCLTTALSSAAPPTLKIPDKLNVDVGDFLVLRAETDGTWVNYTPLPPADPRIPTLKVFPKEMLVDKTATVVSSAAAYRYQVFVYAGNATEGTGKLITVIVGNAPTPPAPPGPGPTPPQPVPGGSAFYKASSTGLGATPDYPTKITDAAALAGAQRAHASAIAAGGAGLDAAGKFSPAVALQQWRDRNGGVVDKAQWTAWGASVTLALRTEYNEGRMPDKASWVAAFNDIAVGLEN